MNQPLHLFRRFLSASTLAVVFGIYQPALVCGQESRSFDEARVQYEAKLEAAEKASKAKKEALSEQYAGAVVRLQEKYLAAGDLENTLKAKAEVETAQKGLPLDGPVFPGLEPLRKVFADNSRKIEKSEQSANAVATKQYLSDLEALKKELTIGGDLATAVKTATEIERIQAEMPSVPESPGYETNTETVKDSPLSSSTPITEDLTLIPGRHQLADRTTLGTRTGTENRKSGIVISPPGALIEDGWIFINVGKLEATGTHFRDVKLASDFYGRLFATDCLFDQSSIYKSGSLYISLFSTKAEFKNCVFGKSFCNVWKTKQLGLKIVDCTFHGVEFTPIEFQSSAHDEALHDWVTIENCHFINCHIPDSWLMASTNCVFERCKFEPDRDMKLDKPIEVTAYLVEGGNPPVPANPNIKVKINPADEHEGSAGSTLNYEYRATRLEFVKEPED